MYDKNVNSEHILLKFCAFYSDVICEKNHKIS